MPTNPREPAMEQVTTLLFAWMRVHAAAYRAPHARRLRLQPLVPDNPPTQAHAVTSILDFVLHLDEHLQYLVSAHGRLTYFILFAIVFAETGLVVFPFLPGLRHAVGGWLHVAQLERIPRRC